MEQGNFCSGFLDLIDLYKDRIIFWDQDVLNKYFDDNFLKLSDNLNFRVYEPVDYKKLDSEAILLHYSGNAKPWTIKVDIKSLQNIFSISTENIILTNFILN